jgi:thioredoxin reductase (NADPH)
MGVSTVSKTHQSHDIIIVGAGPAGLSAGLYAARDRYDVLLLEKNGLPGGQIMLTERVENYPGFERVPGPDLIEAMKRQVLKFGARIEINRAVSAIKPHKDGRLEVIANDGEQVYWAKAVILCPGSDYKRLGVEGEEAMRQATRVSYCATCDGAFYRDKHVLCVGGGNTAVEDSIYLASRFVRKLTLVHRRTEFRAQQVLMDELEKLSKDKDIHLKTPYVVEAIVPTADGEQIDHVRLRNVSTNRAESIKVDGVFVFVGMIPNTGFLRGIVDMNEAGYIHCDPTTLKTSMRGVFVAGDCRQQAAMQLATACADGVLAEMMVKQYFRDARSWGAKVEEEGVVEGY